MSGEAGSRAPPRFPSVDLDVQVYAELMRLARAQLSRAGTLSLDAPMLVHESYLRFHRQGAVAEAERRQFYAYAAQVMRTVIVDYVRARCAQRRGGGEAPVTLTTGVAGTVIGENGIERLHESMQALNAIDPRAHQIVELRYFGGLTEAEIAQVIGVSVPTIKRDWRKARAFLYDAIATP